MTTLRAYPRVCGQCGRQSMQRQLASCSTFDEPDLDGRPAPMLRDTMQYWIERCPYCGYAAESIRKKPHISQAILSGLIRAVGCMDSSPMLAQDFMGIALRYESKRDPKSAVRWSLCAAWVCDDDQNDSGALCAREWCLQRFSPLLAKGKKAARRQYAILYADLLRRTGSDNVLTFAPCENLLDTSTAQLLNCERELFLLGEYGASRAEECDDPAEDDFHERPALLAAGEICKRLPGDATYLELSRLLCEDAAERRRALFAYPARMTGWAQPLVEYQNDLHSRELYDDCLPPVDALAMRADPALFALLEGYVLPRGAACPPYENALAMALLHLLYKSEHLPERLTAYGQSQQTRLYLESFFYNMEELFFSGKQDVDEEIATRLLIEPKRSQK